jgi:hypothetical protein
MPARTFTDEERQARREADRRRTREAVEALRASDGWQNWLALGCHCHNYTLFIWRASVLAGKESGRPPSTTCHQRWRASEVE